MPLPGSEVLLVRKNYYYVLKFIVTCYYGKQPLRGLFGVSSPRPETQLVAPQPTSPTENIGYEIPSGMIEQLLVNPYAGDGTKHPDMHLIYVDEICGLFSLAGLSEDEAKKKVFPLSLKGKALACIGYRMILDLGTEID